MKRTCDVCTVAKSPPAHVSAVCAVDLFLMISTQAPSAPSSLSSGRRQRSSDTADSAANPTSGRSVC